MQEPTAEQTPASAAVDPMKTGLEYPPEVLAYRRRLLAVAPKREDFPPEEQGPDGDFEEALGYWQSHQGRILAMQGGIARNRAAISAEPEPTISTASDETKVGIILPEDRDTVSKDEEPEIPLTPEQRESRKTWFQKFIEASGSVTLTPTVTPRPLDGPPTE